jgi:hypothetical protein
MSCLKRIEIAFGHVCRFELETRDGKGRGDTPGDPIMKVGMACVGDKIYFEHLLLFSPSITFVSQSGGLGNFL